jgi:hypothetical protein
VRSPPIGIAVGLARLARLQFWPALKDLSMYSLRIREDGMREPHWHPITAEMGYVAHRHAQQSRRHEAASVGLMHAPGLFAVYQAHTRQDVAGWWRAWVFWLAPLVGAIAGVAYPYLFGSHEELADRPVRDDLLEEPSAR